MITNDAQLVSILIKEMSEIINIISEELVKILKEKIIQIVYDPFTPKAYERQMGSGGFLGSWDYNSQTFGNKIQSIIESNPASMVIDRENFIHGSAFNDYYSDIRSALPEIINEGKSGPLFDFAEPPLWWKSPRPFWDEFLKLLDSGKIDKLIEKEFKLRNIKFKKG